MTSRDRMDAILAAAVRSGFNVRQTETGAWHFRKGFVTLSFHRTPITALEWQRMIESLKGADMVWHIVDTDAPTDV